MSIFKCKMCGGNLNVPEGATVAECEYCGTKQTLPKLDDDQRANLYDRANHFRRNNEFDKAMGMYEKILNEDKTDAEAYWSLVLCRYGIEYVEDPSTHKRVPTVNRAQYTSVFDDDNYKSALHYADTAQKEVYEAEAKAINEIQKGILAISQREEPFDIFICYKETDKDGRRTPDSVLANDLYHQLTQEGFKVFFSRITLEDKLGTAYEPYIFAALNSSKVMVVLGTNPEYFNAVWVKNEWSRYLSLIKNGANKILIPAFRDMDPYDLPEEFSHLQAQDMSKLGFMQDLIRGIKKIIGEEPHQAVVKETVVTKETNTNYEPLLERAFMFLEDGNWTDADSYCEKVLDLNPKCAEAYLGKLMAELRVRKKEKLADCADPFNGKNNYQKILRFGSDELISTLGGYIKHINERNELARLERIYSTALKNMQEAKFESSLKQAAKDFQGISNYKNSAKLAKKCLEKAEIARKDKIYNDAKSKLAENTKDALVNIADYEDAVASFKSISGWRDADELSETCSQKIEELKKIAEEARIAAEKEKAEKERKEKEAKLAAERARKKWNKFIAISIPSFVIFIIFILLLSNLIIPNFKYNKATKLMNNGNFNEAVVIFKSLKDYKNSEAQLKNCFLESFGRDEYSKIRQLNIGDTLEFGTYAQNQGKIEWIILDKEDNKFLIISKYALYCKEYNDNEGSINWQNCSLRSWLNDEFLNSTFEPTEQVIIQDTSVLADDTSLTLTHKYTTDKLFLLDKNEATKYFKSEKERECIPTGYTKASGGATSILSDGKETCAWWLRSRGEYSYTTDIVDFDGSIYKLLKSNGTGACVRPAMWITRWISIE